MDAAPRPLAPTHSDDGSPALADPERQLGSAMLRGARGQCPACGSGSLFSSYLKVRAACPSCGEDLTAQRADDGPAYLTIFIVSHLVGPLLLAAYLAWRPSPLTLVAAFCVGATVLSLILLPRIKGALVGLQWAKRMHGFGLGGTDPW